MPVTLYDEIRADGPAIYWPFTEAADGSTVADHSVNNRPGIEQGTGASLASTALVPFSRSTVNVGDGYWASNGNANDTGLDVGTGDFTYELWLKITNNLSDYVEIMGRDAAATGNGQMLYLNTGNGYARVYTGGTAATLGTTRISDGLLHHIVYRRISGTHSVVVDGVQQGSGSATGDTNVASRALRLGVAQGVYQRPLGNWAHFAYYKYGLTDAQISKHYLLGLRGDGRTGTYMNMVMAESSLRGYWPLDEASGTVAACYGPAPNGSYINTPTLGATGPAAPYLPLAVDLDGSTEYVSIPDHSTLDVTGSDITLECWAKRDGTSNDVMFDKTAGTGSNSSYFAYFNGASSLRFQWGNGGAPWIEATGLTGLTDWNHWAFVGKTSGTPELAIYRNGVLIQSGSPGIGTPGANALPLLLGAFNGPSDYFDGKMAHAAVYARALTAAELLEHYRAASMDTAAVTVY